MIFNAKIYKMGNKIGIFLNKTVLNKINLPKGEYVKITIANIEKKTQFIAKLNYNIILRKEIEKELMLTPNDILKIKIKKINNTKRTQKIFNKNKIDLLPLVPEKTFLGYEIFVDVFRRDNEQWLRIWYAHERGSGRQIEIKRYSNPSSFGRILGQLQAEGDKFIEKRKHRVVFTNKLLDEHKDFIQDILVLGINSNDIELSCKYNPSRFYKDEVEKSLSTLCNFFNISNFKIKAINDDRVWCSFRTTIRKSVLTEILLNAMDTMRKETTNQNLSSELEYFAYNFISKLLTGDGTIDIRKRDYDYPSVRIKITDQSLDYLNDYEQILKKFGFKAKVDRKNICVKSHCSFQNLLFLYKIRAFENTNNWNKLLVVIFLHLNGRMLKTRLRFLDLQDNFTSFTIRDKYNVELRSANDWIQNMQKSGYIRLVGKTQKPYKYELTEKAIEEIETISQANKELEILIKKFKTKDLWILLSKLKTRGKSS